MHNEQDSDGFATDERSIAKAAGVYDLGELIQETAEAAGCLHNEVDHILKTAFDILAAKIAENGSAQVHKFGSFKTRVLPAESGTDPNGNPYEVGERVTIEFNPFKSFRERLTAESGLPAIP